MKKVQLALVPVIAVFSFISVFADANTGDFTGGVAIGSSYAGTTTAPANGLIVQGNVGIGTTSPGDPLDVVNSTTADSKFEVINTNTGSGNVGIELRGHASGSAQYIDFTNSSTSDSGIGTPDFSNRLISSSAGFAIIGSNVGIEQQAGSYALQVNGSVAGTSAYVNLSDVRYKKNIEPLNLGLEEIQHLKPISFEWKDPKDAGMRGQQIGFVAQDVEEVLPSIVLTADNDEKTKGMKYSEIIPVLVKAVQELKAENDGLRSEFEAYKEAHP